MVRVAIPFRCFLLACFSAVQRVPGSPRLIFWARVSSTGKRPIIPVRRRVSDCSGFQSGALTFPHRRTDRSEVINRGIRRTHGRLTGRKSSFRVFRVFRGNPYCLWLRLCHAESLVPLRYCIGSTPIFRFISSPVVLQPPRLLRAGHALRRRTLQTINAPKRPSPGFSDHPERLSSSHLLVATDGSPVTEAPFGRSAASGSPRRDPRTPACR